MKIAILGAECTGKTTLASALTRQLRTEHPDVIEVAEYLREWCDSHGRTPRADEQAAIAQVQQARILSHGAAWVVCDTAPLITAVYSDVIFGDDSLFASAVAQHCMFDITLVTGLDIAWVGDGIQRDGEAMRQRVDQRLRRVLAEHRIDFSAVYGNGDARTQSALQTIRYASGSERPHTARSNWTWNCDKCSNADCEHRLFSELVPR
jgi:nicotinamide riboside kinase